MKTCLPEPLLRLPVIYSRPASAVDPDGSQIRLWPCSGAVSISIWTTCTIAGASITFRWLGFTSVAGVPQLAGVSPVLACTADAGTADYQGAWLGTPSGLAAGEIAGWDLIGIKVDSITAGSVWTLGALVAGQWNV